VCRGGADVDKRQGPGPSYGIIYKLDDGRYLGGVRHTDRGDLMTDIAYGKTEKSVTPARWA